MIIAFALNTDLEYLPIFLKSVQGHEIWQITDEEYPEVPGCKVFRFPKLPEDSFMYWRAQAYAAFNKPGLYIDADTIVNKDPTPIWNLDFDVAVTKTWVTVKDPSGFNLTKVMPYNGGVVFVKHPEFWPHVAELMGVMPEENRKWYGDQLAIADLVKMYHTIELPNKIYNYTPKVAEHENGTDLSDKWILHFKGKRKDWMRAYDLQRTKDQHSGMAAQG